MANVIALSDEQARAVAAHPGEPVRLLDPATGRAYVLVAADVYDRAAGLLTDDPRDAYPAIDRTFAAGWDAPGMDDYDRYEDIRQ